MKEVLLITAFILGIAGLILGIISLRMNNHEIKCIKKRIQELNDSLKT